jgi:carnitine O-acetyltransferase
MGDNGMTHNGDRPHLHQREVSATFAAQGDLKRLPIPSLDETLNKFPRVLMALQTPEEQKETLKIVEEFRKGVGPRLQALLEEYEAEGRKTGEIGSYVEEFWNDSYLAPDQSVVLNLNPFFVLEEGPDPKTAKDQICRASALTFASVKLASRLKHETLEPDIFRGQPLDMDQFRALFGCCRIRVGEKRDAVAAHPDSCHVVVLSRSQIYYFQALWPDGTVAVDEADIADILRAIRKDSREMSFSEAGKHALGVSAG